MTAEQNGDMAALEALFAEDVVSYSDGGGLVRATNGQAAVLILHDGVPFGLTVDASAQGINEIMRFLRPSKLNASQGQSKARLSVMGQNP